MGFDHETARAADAETRLAGRAHDPKDELRLWLRLYTCTTLIEGEVRSRLRERFDVTLPRFDLLAQLERAPEGLTLGELSRRMMVSNGNITGLVQRLVDSKHLERVAHATDRRVSYVRLTKRGRLAFDAMAADHAAWIATLLAEVTAGDKRALLNLLGTVKQSVQTAASHGRPQ